MRSIIRFLLYLIGIPVLLFVFFLLYITLSDYRPDDVEQLAKNERSSVFNSGDTLRFFNWNIGYCGLGDDMSFFYDGGTKVRTSHERTIENLNGIIETVKNSGYADFYLFQEIDLCSHRSYKINEQLELGTALSECNSVVALNYKVPFVPVPLSDPMGKVLGGLATFTPHLPSTVDRHSFEGNYSWPKGLFMLDRCFLVHRFPMGNRKQLLVVNTHNSAYDDGTLRQKQMQQMKAFLEREYKLGNYIIIGGDWNQNPPDGNTDTKVSTEEHLTRIRIPADFMPDDWTWAYSESIPTNRMLNIEYTEGITKTSIIDFFLLSPNIELVSNENFQLNFRYSDHNPVKLTVVLKN